MCSWLDSKDLHLVPEPIRSKVNDMMQDYHNTVLSLQNDLSHASFLYENSISELKRKLEEKCQMSLELQMENLKHRTVMNKRPRTDSPAGKGFRHVAVLKSKIRILAQKNAELARRESGLNRQVEFLIRNADKDVQELCQIVADQAMELSDLRTKNTMHHHTECVKSDRNLAAEIDCLRRNEKEYQNFIFEQSKEIYSLQASNNDLTVRSNVLEQFRQKYDSLHDEYIRVCAILSEIKLSNVELKLNAGCSNAKSEILAEIERLREYQIGMSSHLDRVFESITNPSNRSFDCLEVLISDMKQRLSTIIMELKAVNFVCERVQSYKTQFEKLFSNACYTIDVCKRELKDKDGLIEQFKATVHQPSSNGNMALENSLLRKESEALALQLKSVRPSTEFIVENENIVRQNRLLISDIESQRDEIDKLNSVNKLLSEEVSSLRDAHPSEKDCHDKISQLEDRIKQLSEQGCEHGTLENGDHIRNLESQMDCYKQDVRTIENQFSEYKRAFKSFNIQEAQDGIRDLRENIGKKDVLISRLYSLVNKYRELKGTRRW